MYTLDRFLTSGKPSTTTHGQHVISCFNSTGAPASENRGRTTSVTVRVVLTSRTRNSAHRSFMA